MVQQSQSPSSSLKQYLFTRVRRRGILRISRVSDFQKLDFRCTEFYEVRAPARNTSSPRLDRARTSGEIFPYNSPSASCVRRHKQALHRGDKESFWRLQRARARGLKASGRGRAKATL